MNAYTPRSYQQVCLENLATAREQGANKALVVMASGLGKTLTGAFDILSFLSANPNGRVLVLCHSEPILSQTKEVFRNLFGDGYSYGMYNGKEKTTDRTDFLFANLQSVNLHKDAFDPEEFAFIIVDEAHHSPATTYREAIEYFHPQFLLGMTATPERMDDANLSEIFGETVFEYRLPDAVYDGWLSKVDYRLELDELEKLDLVLDSGEPVSMSRLNQDVFIPLRDEKIIQLIRERTAEKENPTMVIFCRTIEHANQFAALMGDAVVIHSDLKPEEVSKRLADFRSGKISTVCTVNMLNEGIDIPRTDVIVFLRVTQSKIVLYQQLGRGLRPADGKGEVLVLDFVANGERINMIAQMEREFKSAAGRFPRKKKDGERECFTLNIDTPKFREQKYDIIAAVAKAMEFKFEFTDEELIEDFRKECEDLGHFPRQDEFHYHPNTVYRMRFGSLRKVAQLAGCMEYWNSYDQRSRNFPEEEALDLLAEMFHALNRVPIYDEINSAEGMPTAQYYRLHFGGTINALALRNIFPTKDQVKVGMIAFWNKANIPESLRMLDAELDHPIRKKDVENCEYTPGMVSIDRVFGTLAAALLYAGVRVGQIKPTKNNTALSIYRELGLPTDYEELCRFVIEHHDEPNSPARLIDAEGMKRRLKARENAGRPSMLSVRPPREEMIKAIQLKADQLGRVPTRRDMDSDPNMPSSYFIRTEFGSYNAGMAAAGLTVNPKYIRKAR